MTTLDTYIEAIDAEKRESVESHLKMLIDAHIELSDHLQPIALKSSDYELGYVEGLKRALNILQSN